MLHAKKAPFLILADILIVMISLIVSAAIKYDSFSGPFITENNIPLFAALCCATIIINGAFGCYRCILKLAGVSEALRQILASIFTLGFYVCAFQACNLMHPGTGKEFPLSLAFISVMIQLALMCAVRFSYRFYVLIRSHVYRLNDRTAKRKTVVFGNPQSNKAIIEKLHSDKSTAGNAVCIINVTPTDEKYPIIGGIRAYGYGFDKLEEYLIRSKADQIVISKNDVGKDLLLKTIKLCSKHRCEILMYSGIENYYGGIRSINVNDLLGRSPAVPEKHRIYDFIKGKTILVTGGAGSIGSEICRQVLEYGCSKLIIFDICENYLFELNYELNQRYSHDRYVTIVGSVRDEQRLDEVFALYRPDIVFHAAAHKHVPMMEANPGEAVKNNVMGTYNTAKKAVEYGAGNFILISTDKAVKPASVMGATKRAAEMIVQSMNSQCENTKLAAVRFGNVLNSNGSVMKIFKRQIMSGGPVTVTHPDMERYFMTIGEAVTMVMQAGAMANGGEIYVLDMGMPVKIVDLAKAMIRLYNFEPGKDIKIEYTGMRPGEKMAEKLVLDEETIVRVPNSSFFVCKPCVMDKNFMARFHALMEAASHGNIDYRTLLNEIIRQYETGGEPSA